MMKITMRILFIIIFITLFFSGISQEKGQMAADLKEVFGKSSEISFTFQTNDRDLIDQLSRIISIDNVRGETVFAYASLEEFVVFLSFDIPFEILSQQDDLTDGIRMLDEIDVRDITSWDFYPTYEGYLSMMNQFAAEYPALCQVFSIGTSVQGRQLMMAKISKNVSVREPEPQFLYTGTIHGDELAGYVLLLRLIDYLLVNYPTNPDVAYLLDNVEIWINPLANPDGTFKGGNHTVAGSVRYNANNVDLNRNYPDPEDGQHPDNKPWQPETLAFMQLAENNNFAMSANTHGGEEVLNYPWDTWSRLAADNNWWVYVCREYVDTVHLYSPSTYLDGFSNGITNGYAWYTISGGRQDYMNYFHHCREVTMELSLTKKLAASQLNNHWNWNYRSLLNYIEQVTYGVAGTVTDIETGEPLSAKIFITGHDMDNSHVFSDNQFGFYQRLLDAGTYDLTFTVPGYLPVTIQNVIVSRYNRTSLDVEMDAGDLDAVVSASENIVPVGTAIDFTDESTGNPVSWHWTFQGGQPGASFERYPEGILFNNSGTFDVTLTITNGNGEAASSVFEDFIHVSPGYPMSNQSVTTCSALFYDSGGQSGNYANNESITMTFVPGMANAKLSATFLDFSVQSHSSCGYDWLKVFDGVNTSAVLIGTYCGTNSPETITATNIQGALTFQFQSNTTVNNPGWRALISCIIGQQIALNEGWSGVSTNIHPSNPDIEILAQSLAPNLIIILGDEGIYYPAVNINTLETWNARRGYTVKLSNAATFSIEGKPVQNKTIALTQGWNIVPVLTATSVSTDLIASILGDSLIIITEVAGFGVYWPEHAIHTLEFLHPGKAYYVKTSATQQFTFPEP